MNTAIEEVRSLFDQSSDLVQVATLDGTLLYTNPTWQRVLGYDSGDRAASMKQVLHPEDWHRYQQVCAGFYVQGENTSLNLTLLTRAGVPLAVEGQLCYRLSEELPQVWCLWRLLYIPAQTLLDRHETDLKESETRNRAILDAIPDLLFRVSADGIYLEYFTQPQAIDFFGVQKVNPVGKRMIDLLPPDIAQRHLHGIQQTLLTQKLQVYEQQIQIGDTLQYEEIRIVPCGDNAVLFMIRDISKRKKLEEERQRVEERLHQLNQELEAKFKQRTLELRESEARLYNLLNITSDWIWEVDTAGRYTYVNDCVKEILGYEPHELVGKTPFHLMPPDEAQRNSATFAEIVAQGRPFRGLENRNLTRDGREIVIETNGIPVFSPDGQLQGYRGVCRDVSDRRRVEDERKAAEAALRESEIRFRTLVQNVNVGIVVHDAQTNILLSNPSALDLLGLTEDQLLGKTSFDPQWRVIRENGTPLPGSEHPVSLAIASREAVHNIVIGVHRPNTGLRSDRYPDNVVWLLVNADPQLTPAGEVHQVIVSFTDITYRKQLETNAFEALQKERELKEMRSRFVSMISHEFRTPLAVILSASEILQLLTGNVAGCKEYFTQMGAAIERITQMLDDVLWLGKVDSGQMELRYDGIDLAEFCQEILREFQLAYGRIYQFCLECRGQPQTLLLDPKLLRPMLNNLLSNAVKYSAEHSVVTLRLIYETDQVVLQIQDQGIGIPEADHQQLFEAFYRGRNVETIQGTGLGLAIVKHCVDLHGGQISLESQVGIGTTFTIQLPYSRAVFAATSVAPSLTHRLYNPAYRNNGQG